MVYAGRFEFLNIFHHDDFEKSLSKAVEAFKVWASRGIPAGRKFSKCVLRSKKCLRHVNKVAKPFQMTLRPFSNFSSFFFFFLLFFFFFSFFFFFLLRYSRIGERRGGKAAAPYRAPLSRIHLCEQRLSKWYKLTKEDILDDYNFYYFSSSCS